MSAARWHPGQPLASLRSIVERGGLLVIPTESSYGLGVDPQNEVAVASVYRVKGRSGDKPLPVVAADERQLRALGVDLDPPLIRRLARLWPAPLTVVAPLARQLPAAAGERGLAVRIPASRLLRQLLSELGRALTATSANRSGEPPVLAPGAAADLVAGVDAAVVDGGELAGGPPSTLVAVREDRVEVLRQGAYPLARLRGELGDLRVAAAAERGVG